jgi:hypothetical protein
MHQDTAERLEKDKNGYKMVTPKVLETDKEKWLTNVTH